MPLKLVDGRATEKCSVSNLSQGTWLFFFEGNRNLIEGDISVRQVVGPFTRESVERLRPGWRKIARGYSVAPVEFVIDGAMASEVTVDFDLRFYARNIFVPNHRESEKVLMLFLKTNEPTRQPVCEQSRGKRLD
jgi:hypothetical protein